MRDSLRNASWIDLLFLRMEAQPIPLWLTYAVLGGLVAGLNAIVFWDMPETTLYQNAYGGLYPVVILALIHFMHHLAGSTFDQFRPSLDLPPGKVERQRNHFLMAPAWFGLLFLLLGLQSGVAQVMGEAGYARSLGIDVSPLMIAMGFVTLGASSVFTTYFLANTIRRLRLIILLHRKVGEVDLYHLESLRAFLPLQLRQRHRPAAHHPGQFSLDHPIGR